MNFLTLAIIFCAAVWVTIRRGPGGALVYVLLPVKLLLHQVKPVDIEPLPNFDSTSMVSYGALLGMLVAGNFQRIKIHPLDVFVVASTLMVSLSSFLNGVFWTLMSSLSNEMLQWIVPYYLARCAFHDGKLRRDAALICAFLSMFNGFIGIVELRLIPYVYSRLLEGMGILDVANTMVLGRFGLFRAQVGMAHPIDLGNVGGLMLAMIPALAITGGLKLTDWRITAGMAGAALMLVAGMSFTSFLVGMAVVGIYVSLRYVPATRALILPGIAMAIVMGIFFTNYLINYELGDRRAYQQAALQGSFDIRALIVQRAWVWAQDAGVFGYGERITQEQLALDSVDNSYILFVLKRGWSYLILWFVMMFVLGYTAMQMLGRAKDIRVRIPVAFAVAGLFATLLGMYTVWFGFVYQVIWCVLLALVVTLQQVLSTPAAARVPNPPLPRHFPVGAPRRMAS